MGKPVIYWAYLIGGYYDLILGFALLLSSRQLVKIFNIEMVINIFNELTGLFLLAIGFLLVVYAKNAMDSPFIGLSSVFVRFSFVILVILYSVFSKIHYLFIVFALTDFLTGLMILIPIVNTLRTQTGSHPTN
jgi:hypothetical protein